MLVVIAVRGRERSVGRASFGDAIDYALRMFEPVPPIFRFHEGVTSLETAGAEMTVVARAYPALDEPVYHLVISWSPGEHPSFEQAREAARHTLKRIGFAHPQYVAVMHNDGVGSCWHLHIVANRRDAVTGRVVDTYDDYKNMMGAMRELEVSQGWRRVEYGERMRVGTDRYNAHRRHVEFVRRGVREAIASVVSSERGTWTELHEALHNLECRYEVVKERASRVAGAVKERVEARIVAVATGVAALVREAGTTHEALCRRFGAYVERGRAVARERESVIERARRVRDAVLDVDVAMRSWRGVHEMCAQEGLAIVQTSNARRFVVVDIASGATVLGSSCGMSRVALERLIGSRFESGEESAKREAQRRRHEEREDEALARKLIANPSPVIATLTERQSAFTVGDLDDDLATRFRDAGVMTRVREAVVKACVAIRAPFEKRRSEDWGLRLTSKAILEEERDLVDHASALARSEQSGERRLRVVIGADEQKRSEMIHAAAERARESGGVARILSVSSAESRILREHTGLAVASVASELARVRENAVAITSGDVVVLSGAEKLGSEDGRALVAAVRFGDASLLCFAGERRGSSVARGDALGSFVQACVDADVPVLDFTAQPSQWRAEAMEDLRAGRIAQGLARLRDRGVLHGALSRESARSSLVQRWREDVSNGAKAYVVVADDAEEERRRAGRAAREALRAAGYFGGRDVSYDVMDGRLPFAVGERVIFREAVAGTKIRAGSEAEIVAMRGSVWSVEIDGMRYAVNVDQHSGVQYAYALPEPRVGAGEFRLITPGATAFNIVTRSDAPLELFYDAESFPAGLVAGISEATLAQEKVLAQQCALLTRDAQTLVRQSDDGVLVAAHDAAEEAKIEDNFAEQSGDVEL